MRLRQKSKKKFYFSLRSPDTTNEYGETIVKYQTPTECVGVVVRKGSSYGVKTEGESGTEDIRLIVDYNPQLLLADDSGIWIDKTFDQYHAEYLVKGHALPTEGYVVYFLKRSGDQ